MGQEIQIKYKGKVIETVDSNARELSIVSSGIKSIRDIEGLDQLVDLEKLTVNPGLVDTEGLEKLARLKELNLGLNSITTIAGLDQLINLEVLNLERNRINRIKGLDRLVHLKELVLDGNHIIKIEGLDQLVSLEKLRLWRNGINKIEGLDQLVNLKVLDLGNNHIVKIEKLDQLVNLEELYLYLNQIAVIEGLSGLVNLKKLDVIQQRVQITKIEGLADLEKLESINLRATEIATDEVIDQFTKLLAKMGKEASSQLEYDRCGKMNQKAKAALMAKDLTLAASVLNELKAYCGTRDHQTVNIICDNERYGGSEEYEQNPHKWLIPAYANLKIVKKIMKASKGPSGVSEGSVEEAVKSWKDHPAAAEARPGCIGHAEIPPETKLRARIFSIMGAICGFFIGWAGASLLEGCIFGAIGGISMYLLVIAMTSNSRSLPSNTILLVIITAALGGAGYLIGALGSGDWLLGLGLGLKVGLLIGIVQSLGCWNMMTIDRIGVLVLMALGAGAGAGIGALVGLFTPAGAGYGAGVGMFIGTPVVIIYFSRVISKSYLFVHISGIVVGFIVGAALPVGVGMGIAWGLYIVLLAFVIVLLGSICVRYQHEDFPEESRWD
ncbi:MAG: leucine-rich repeat domain-containing protein [Candidatus Sigynarchaeota archaeon]